MKSSAKTVSKPVCHSEPKNVVQPHKNALLKRLNRIEGQVRGISKMVEGDRYCIDILTQISAIKSALNAVGMQLLEDHTKGCVQNAIKSGNGDDELAELLTIVRQFVR
ncbi:metal-sensitive transcriptional regulator [Sulfurirhabdus autotrophica]|uniref:DNA-binding FrmR family transcriptional regulator n=1 Tax=Sulfurirhabdus autotrophica TaxID=1706046 RepID=A0A4R3YED2_9PROT|nr:metal-sensitive transcriptional regulator [Sulfurirhabdus autotrophica]TCV90420.1 DNA-binding FrmR family transcriptional regulator [Sulfurirhabdus autotrophica]